MLYLMTIFILEPHNRRRDDKLALVAQCEILLLLQSGLVLQSDGSYSIDSPFDIIMSIILIFVVLAALILFIYHVVLHFRKLWWDTQRDAMKQALKDQKQASQIKLNESGKSSSSNELIEQSADDS